MLGVIFVFFLRGSRDDMPHLMDMVYENLKKLKTAENSATFWYVCQIEQANLLAIDWRDRLTAFTSVEDGTQNILSS